MKKIVGLVKDYIISGAIVIVPIAIVCVILAGVFMKLVNLMKPLTSKMTFGGVISDTLIAIIVVIILLGIFFLLAGIFFNTRLGKVFHKWIEKNIFSRIPLYDTLSNITKQFVGIEKSNYKVVEVDLYGTNNTSVGLWTDTLSDGRCVVYFPFSPLMNVGQLHFLPQENLKVLDVSVKDAIDVFGKIGLNANIIYKKTQAKISDN